MMDNNRKEYLLSLDVSKIEPNGEYYYFSKNPNATLLYQKIRLTDSDILFLREYYHRRDIAVNRVGPNNSVKYVIGEDRNKYNHRGRVKNKPKPIGKKIIIGGLVITLVIGGYKLLEPKKDVIAETISVEYQSPIYWGEGHSEAKLEEISNKDDEVRRLEVIKHLCDIYQVDYVTVYNKLKEITNNFSSNDYLNGCIEGVSCKGFDVKADSEDELLTYAIRTIKQAPDRLGMSTEDLYINNGYDSGTDYSKMISDISEVLGINRDLMYAIVNAETSFSSDLFQTHNNPAGLRDASSSTGWWQFANKEEGLIEFGMELIKYYKILGIDKLSVSSDTISKIGSIHAPLSDGNANWLPNVLEGLEYAQNNEQALFGGEEIHGLGR